MVSALHLRRTVPQSLVLGLFLGSQLAELASAQNEEREASLKEDCFVVGDNKGLMYSPFDFYDHIMGWLERGAPQDVRGSVLDTFSNGMKFGLSGHPDELPLECRSMLLVFAFTNQILHPVEEDLPWGIFLRAPWEDLASSKWPVFPVLHAFARTKTALRTKATEADAKAYFWRSCQSDETFELWQRPTVAMVGDMLFASMGLLNSTSSPGVKKALAQATAMALLEVVSFTALTQFDGLCSNMALPLLTAGLALAQSKSFLQPGYALRLLQSAMQRSEIADEEGWHHDLEAAPWPILALVGAVALEGNQRHPIAETITQEVHDPGPGQAGETRGEGGSEAAVQVFRGIVDQNQELLDAMRVAHGLCDALEIEYYAICGTLLGALRHRGPIPWDDDADLCVNALVEPRLLALVVAEDVARLSVQGGDTPQPTFPPRVKRAHQFLQREGYVVELVTTRSLTFRVVRAGPDGFGDASAPYVDIWMCFDLADGEFRQTRDPDELESGFEGVVLMSRRYGPRIPRSAFYPRRKVPFGDLAIWAPHDPMEVLRRYFAHGGHSQDFMNVCATPKVHLSNGTNVEYKVSVPCKDLGIFAGPWQTAGPGPALDEVLAGVRSLMGQKLYGLAADPVEEPALTVQVSTLGPSMPDRWLVEGWVPHADGSRLFCEALLWRGNNSADDMREPGWLGNSGQVVRSFICRPSASAEPTFVWEDFTLDTGRK